MYNKRCLIGSIYVQPYLLLDAVADCEENTRTHGIGDE